MSLKDNIIEKIINYVEENQVSSEILQNVTDSVIQKAINLSFAQVKHPNIEWNDDLPTPLELLSSCVAGKINSDNLTTDFSENLKIIKIILFIQKGDEVKGLENKEKRLEFYIDLEPNTKIMLDIIYNLLKKNKKKIKR